MRNCQNCGCPSCAEAAEVQRILEPLTSMEDIPEKVLEYWDRQQAEEAAQYPGRKSYNYFEEGRLVKRVVVDVFAPEEGGAANGD